MKSKKLIKYKKALWIVIIVLLIAFVVLTLFMRQSIKGISRDPSVNSLTNESIFRIVQIFNINKNRGEECWNMKSPFLPCAEDNKIIKGDYSLRGTKDAKWLDGPIEGPQQLSEEYIREVLGGFMKVGETYNQTITISCPTEFLVQIKVTTENSDDDTSTQVINLNAK